MVLDHELEKQVIERRSGGIRKDLHLLRTSHAGHELGIVLVVGCQIRHLQVPTLQPVPHHVYLVFLRQCNALRKKTHGLARRSLVDEHRHLQRLSMMSDHALHELDVRGGELDARKIGSLLYRDSPTGLPRCARLNDGYLA